MDFNLAYALKLLHKHDAVLLDVRTYKEFCQGHLCGATLIPTQLPPLSNREKRNLKDQLRLALDGVPIDHPIIVYCKKGIRAGIAKDLLQQLGYEYVMVLGGVEVAPLNKVMSGEMPVLSVCGC